MPKINRVRIVNFSYNNNNRHIIDECFDFYGGENALLSLANGGGKSVLVQTILQPILPKVSLLGRKFGDFFIAKRTPTYIMLEWKLDDDAGYLLTGIAVTSRVSHSTNEEEENAEIRYFTFLNAYEEGNDFDIKHIPVTEQIGSSVRIASYSEFKKLLQKEAGKNNYELFVYDSTREEQSQYERKLSSYSISREEWKELIVNINEAEHGVSEVFSECKTSRKVMEQWVIKYIEKVLNKSSSSDTTDHKKLETMMAQVAQALVDNEKHIREFRAIEGFKNELDTVYTDTKAILTNLDNEGRLKKDITGGYQIIRNEEERLGQELAGIEKRLKELGEELELIALEEKSQEIYKYTEEIEVLEERLLELGKQIEAHKSHLDEKNHKLLLQKAAEKHAKIVRKEKTISQLQQRLENASKDQDKLLKDLNRVKYSLKIAYSNQLTGINDEVEAVSLELKNITDRLAANQMESREFQTQLIELTRNKGGVEKDISNFEKEEPTILEGLNLRIFRNPLLKELDPKEVSKAEAQLAKEYQDTEILLNNSKLEAEKTRDTLNVLAQKREEAFEKDKVLSVEKAGVEAQIKEYEAERQKLLDAMKRLNINAEYLFDPVYLMKAVREYLNGWENKAYNLKMEISELEKQMYGIEKGVSYLPASLISLMEDNNLPCYTGEKYLREISEDEKMRLLIDNPLLPYALIATEKEITLLEQLVAGMELSQAIPVIRHNQREQKIVTGYEKIQFITSSGNITLDNENIDIFVKSLMEKKSERLLELEKTSEVIDRVNNDYQIIANFSWTEKQVRELVQERAVNEDGISENSKALQSINQEIEAAVNQQDKAAQRIEELKSELSARQERNKGFEKYLAKNASYMDNVRLYGEISSKTNSLGVLRKKNEEDRTKLADDAEQARRMLDNRSVARKVFEDKLAEVAACDTDKLIEEDIPVLEGRFEGFKEQQNNEITDLNRQIKGLNADIQSEAKEIKKWKLEAEEYKSLEYSESLEAELEMLCDKLRLDIEGLKKDENEYQNKRLKLSERIAVTRENLAGRAVIPIEKIRGDFSKRREAANRESFENRTRNNLVHEERRELASLVSKIETEVRDVMYSAAEPVAKSFEQVMETIDSMLQEYSKFRHNTNEAIEQFKKRSSLFVNKYSMNEEGTVKEAVKGLQYQIEGLDRSYDKYYYLTERMEYYFTQLAQILKIMENKMLQLEHSQKDLTEHAFMEARRIYYEIPKISENSAVEIDGVRKRVLEIVFDEMENELQAKEKMEGYIQECLQSVTKLIKGNEDESKLRRDIEKYMSTKELLNIISSLEKCKIRAYKVDLNEKNRGMMLWEDIIIKNSGGEKFVAYFSLLVALISYSRKQIKGYEAFKRKEESKVLIMDNPFGPITSGHLLKPMFDIAKKYNTQLICLSDIKQGSVINSFDLIYMIKIRQNMMQEDFLELEPVMLKELKQDEKLENAHLYGKVEQVSLFDM